ncbi:GEVED domain-containing protein [Desulfosudis oleivorans]|uniref:GEVED domain-containing protein n=1 Tax=Desulfosudis oleivorans (strain DSM 6200 / JCM 39069 / Hxd3) TaxID=96561 RepID=A9A0X0_DESOH|nr:GEVED domain-containing protein [Desulfosudis oleivorans]ABW67595.1 hypothetical protein Dole_1791 [Desulfosudis oleivorans Hxd3]
MRTKKTAKLLSVLALLGLMVFWQCAIPQQAVAEEIGEIDFGDAPDPTYPTRMASNGAGHIIVPSYFMGAGIDGEPDGQPDPNAMGDDNDGNDDEDGVIFNAALTPCAQIPVTIIASAPGFIDAWIDFNIDGDWADAGEQIFTSHPVVAGVNPLNFSVPCNSTLGQTFARFRFSSTGGLSYTGLAMDGEVEDYAVWLEESLEEYLDCGDAPDPSYPTLLANNGACHIIVPQYYLGNSIDNEPDGQPDPNALGDDNNNLDDEDGVAIPSVLTLGMQAPLIVTASAPGFIDAWIDFNADGDWADAGEQIFVSQPVVAGANILNVTPPTNAVPGKTFARFRFSSTGGLSYTGLATDGEVEDYAVRIERGIGLNLIEWNGNLVADFGKNGLWYHNGTSWNWMTNKGYVGQMAVWGGNLVVDFGAGHGLQYYNGTSWTWMSNKGGVNAMTTWHDGSTERLVVDFGGGRRVYTYNGAWSWLSNKDDVNAMNVWNNKLVVDFGAGRGVYNYDTSWHWMSNKDDIALWTLWNNGSTEPLVVDFGGGRRVYTYNGAWSWLTNKDDVNDMAVWNNRLVIDFGAGRGLYNNNGTWNWMSNKDDTAHMVPWNNGTGDQLAVDFGNGRNMYNYNGAWNWIKNANNVPEMVAWNNCLAADFGSGVGIYNYNGAWNFMKSWSTAD